MSVDEVYKTVLYILNKEQRGFLTPEEFNKVAAQVQLELFEKYFEDLTQQLRLPDMTDSEYANRVKTIEEKISDFEVFETLTGGSPFDLTTLTEPLHRLGTIEFTPPLSPTPPAWTNNPTTLPVELEEVTQHEFNLTRRSKLTAPSATWPLFTQKQNQVYTAPNLSEITVYYVRKPLDPIWAYEVGSLGQYIWDGTPGAVGPFIPATGSVDFEISDIEQTEVILRILAYAGVIIRDPAIVTTATQMVQTEDAIEQN
jgi:hypothetical protein